MAELMSRREAFKKLAGLGLVVGGYASTAGTAHASTEPMTREYGEHSAYHAARNIFPVVHGTIYVAEQVQQIDCPIYMFHMPSLGTVSSIVIDNLRAGRLPITVSRLSQGLRGEIDSAELPEKPFVLSFDDGYISQYLQIFPFLRDWSIPATFNVMATGWRGDGVHSYMNADQIREVDAQGSEIASHTVFHPPSLVTLRFKNKGGYLAEIFDSKKQLEELLQKEVPTFAYPTGAYDGQVISDVQAAGYKTAVSTRDFRVQALTALYSLGRSRR